MLTAASKKLPLTITLPIGVAVAVFIIAIGTTHIGVSVLRASGETALRDQAVVFLDAVAGNIAADIEEGPNAVRRQLEAAHTFRTALLEEAIALRWRNSGGTSQTITLERRSADKLISALEIHEAIPPDTVVIEEIDAEQLILVLKSYKLNDPGELSIAATFDASGLNETVTRANNYALLIDTMIALFAAGIVYVVTRRMLAPFDAFTRRLAGEDGARLLLIDSPRNSEIARLETALSMRERSEEERARHREKLAQRERDALLARMAASVAHEVRNPLAGLKNSISTLKRFGDRPEVRDETAAILETGLASIERVVNVTLSTYRRRSGTRTVTSKEIGDIDLLLGAQARHRGVDLIWRLDETLTLFVDADALRQIIVNLLLNAIDVTPKGKRVVVEAGRSTDGQAFIAISDTGEGMSADMIASLVSGDVDNVPAERGLGTWIVSNMVQTIGARLAIHSSSEKGTRIEIILPSSREIETDD
ncbi:sensor histidine kinase [Pararhizobium haloflavum]|uniref:sensor histidine kinase n=1 Tax=Pararhizobium haloflavum TaxID=2037914 RepID=UPI000C19599B|nr:HAMP domain-containing sensor histidine kinase [Pararhizobium haloflavum]